MTGHTESVRVEEKRVYDEDRHTFCSNRCECACMRFRTTTTTTAGATDTAVARTLYRRLRTFCLRLLKYLRSVEDVFRRKPWRNVGGLVSGRARLKFSCQQRIVEHDQRSSPSSV